MRWSQIRALTRAFLGRFIALGLVVFLPVGVLAVALVQSLGTHVAEHGTSKVYSAPGWFGLVLLGLVLILDGLLTFVVPALALSVRSPGRALRMGFRVIRATWPTCAWYVFAPGLTLTVLAAALPRSVIGPWGVAGIAVVGGTLGLWFKGATVALYLRVVPSVGDTGSAYV